MTDRELDAFTPGDWGLLTSLALIWGSSFVFIEIGLESLSPAQIAFLRLLLGTTALALVPASRRRVEPGTWPRLVVLGLLWMGIPFLLFPLAQRSIDSSLAGMLNGGVPLWAALVATIMARRLPPRGVMMGLAAGFTGILLVSLPTLDTEGSSTGGAALIVLATVMYGISLNLAVPLQRRFGTLPVMLRAQGVAAVFTLPFALVGIGDTAVQPSGLAAVAALGVLGTGLALVLMGTLAGRVGAARGSIAIYLVPIVAIVLGTTLQGDEVAPLALVGTGFVIAGAVITSRSQRTTVAPPTQPAADEDIPAVSLGS